VSFNSDSVENIMIICLNKSVFSRQFLIVYFYSQTLMPHYSAHKFSLCPCLYYINRCTAHFYSVTFWIWFCLYLIKVIALAHLAIISTPHFLGKNF
jgi:hypothetical protein